MTNFARTITGVRDQQREGSPDHYELREPFNPLKTATMSVLLLNHADSQATAETGVTPAVALSAETPEAPEGQDALPDSEEMQPESQKEATVGTQTRTPLILIVEDTTELAEVIQATLERVAMRTIHAPHGARALTVLAEQKPDLVLLDIALPDMTGWKILESLKAQHEQAQTRMPIIIVITAYGDPANRLVGKLQEIHSYLMKPFTADEVERVVATALKDRENTP